MAEKIFTIPLRKDWLKAPRYRRSKRAINSLKTYLVKHLKKEVRIGKYLNSEIWASGNKKPPSRVKVRIEEDKDKLTAELINAPREVKKEEKKKGKLKGLKDKVIGESKEKKEIMETAEELGKELEKERKTKEINKELEKERKHIDKEPLKEEKETVGKHKLVPRKKDIKK